MENLNGQTKSTIKFILNQEVVQLNITETKEYLNWGAGGNFWWAFFGPEVIYNLFRTQDYLNSTMNCIFIIQ